MQVWGHVSGQVSQKQTLRWRFMWEWWIREVPPGRTLRKWGHRRGVGVLERGREDTKQGHGAGKVLQDVSSAWSHRVLWGASDIWECVATWDKDAWLSKSHTLQSLVGRNFLALRDVCTIGWCGTHCWRPRSSCGNKKIHQSLRGWWGLVRVARKHSEKCANKWEPTISVCSWSRQPLGAQSCGLGTWGLVPSLWWKSSKMTTCKNFYDLYGQNKLFDRILPSHFLVFLYDWALSTARSPGQELKK